MAGSVKPNRSERFGVTPVWLPREGVAKNRLVHDRFGSPVLILAYANDGFFCAHEFLNSRGQFVSLILPELRRSAAAHMRISVAFARTTSGLDARCKVFPSMT
jgi:hypothetical protein